MGKTKGGKRDGAGRRKGSKNKLSTQAIAVAKETDKLPHEILLAIAQTGLLEHHGKILKLDAGTRISCAESVAPYYAPKLASITQKIKTDTNYVIGTEPLTEDEFESKYGIGVEPPAETKNTA